MMDEPIWPLLQDVRDPWDDDPVLLDEAWKIHRRRFPFGGMDKESFEGTLRAFETSVRAWLGGEASLDSAREHAETLGVAEPPEPDPRGLEQQQDIATAEEIARLGTNGHPDLGSEAPGRVLGPWEQRLTPHDRSVLCMALAEAAFIERVRGEMSAWTRFRRRKPLPAVEERSRVRAVAHTPVGCWTMASTVDGGWRLADRLGLVPRRVPNTPVDLSAVVSVDGSGPHHGGTLVGRVVYTPGGWRCPVGFAVRGQPPAALLRETLDVMLWRQRLVHPRVSVEEVLSDAGYTLVRRVHEWAWCQQYPIDAAR